MSCPTKIISNHDDVRVSDRHHPRVGCCEALHYCHVATIGGQLVAKELVGKLPEVDAPVTRRVGVGQLRRDQPEVS